MEDTHHGERVLRPARVGEEDALTALALRSVRETWGYDDAFMAWEPDSIPIFRAHITDMVTTVLEIDGVPAGVSVLRPVVPGRIELSRLMVAPEAAGTGCGRALWEHAVATSRAMGATVMTLDADPNAEPFYRRMGAETVAVADWEPPMMPGWRLRMMRYAIPPEEAPP